MNTRYLEYFVAAVECGSFTRAAERLYTTQPSFSKQISALETELGVKLFYREHRAVSLTKAGRLYYEEVKDIPSMLKHAKERVHKQVQAENHLIQIGVLEGHLLSPDLMAAIESFQIQNPDLQIRYVRGDFHILQEALITHKLDMILTIAFTLEQESGICMKVLRRQNPYVAICRRNPLSQRSRVSLSDLSQETFVILDEAVSPISYQNIMAMLAQADIPSAHTIYVESTESLFTSVEAGLGVAIVDGENRLKHSANAVLIRLDMDAVPPNLCVAWLPGNSGKVQSLIRYL